LPSLNAEHELTTMRATVLAAGSGWRVHDMICRAGPRDRPFEERHDTVSIAAVVSGTFHYRTTQGSALLAPGAVLLGNIGRSFECSHEHGSGDRCLSFHFTPDYWEQAMTAVPGVRRIVFDGPHLPPTASFLPVTAGLEAAREAGQAVVEETALEFAGAVLAHVGEIASLRPRPSIRDERRISEAVRRIEQKAHELGSDELSLGALAQEAGLSRYHFLRTFRRLVGMTPHQYVLRTRMNRAAVRLRLSDEPVSAIAFDAGFGDLSTFNRRFRTLMGASPSRYRQR
jgi:AraC-like DNA-binding protein